jgi:hypothetical protein
MATRNTQQETVKADVLPALDAEGYKTLRRLVRMADDVERAYAKCRSLNLFEGDLRAFMHFLRGCDPTEGGKYLRWILNRLNRQTTDRVFDLDFADAGQATKKMLLAFCVKTQYLPLDQRDILGYQSVREIGLVLAEHAGSFNKVSYDLLNALDFNEVLEQTLIYEHENLSICAPRSIEEAALLLFNDKWLDDRREGFYRKLKDLGQIYVLISPFGSQIMTLPHEPEQRGVIYDSTGERSMLEEALIFNQITYEDAPEIMALFCKVDPALPFDIGLEGWEAYLVAVNQFPLILHEDRHLEEDVRETLLGHPDLTEAARGIILDCAA